VGWIVVVLDLSKIEVGKLELESVPFDFARLIANIDQLYRASVPKTVEWSVEIDPQIPRKLIGDPTRVQQMLTNFISNAVKFTKMGSIALSITIEDTNQKDDTLLLRFSVRDTGNIT
jgi:signal transduction histidine kinase